MVLVASCISVAQAWGPWLRAPCCWGSPAGASRRRGLALPVLQVHGKSRPRRGGLGPMLGSTAALLAHGPGARRPARMGSDVCWPAWVRGSS